MLMGLCANTHCVAHVQDRCPWRTPLGLLLHSSPMRGSQLQLDHSFSTAASCCKGLSQPAASWVGSGETVQVQPPLLTCSRSRGNTYFLVTPYYFPLLVPSYSLLSSVFFSFVHICPSFVQRGKLASMLPQQMAN